MSTQTPAVTATNWFEVYSKDTQAAIKFYSEVFGWTTESMPMGPDSTYWMLHGQGQTFAGVMDLNAPELDQVPPHWGLYFHTEDCAATIAKVQELGGSLVYGPIDIPEVGTVAGFNDCCGAHFNVHQPANERGDISNCPVNWVEHMGPNREGAIGFYKALFGWGSMDMEMGEPVGTYSMFLIGETPVGGCMTFPVEQGHPCWLIYLNAPSLEETCEKVTAAGGNIMNPPMDIGQFGRIAIASDSTGAVFGLHEPPKGM